jgi:hypothetical protein
MNIENYLLSRRMTEIRKKKANKQDYETLKKLNEEMEKQFKNEDDEVLPPQEEIGFD